MIADITKRMGAGMAEFVSKDLGQGTGSTEEYNKYCHYVAGLVGDGLTRLFAATGIEGQELLLAPELANRCDFSYCLMYGIVASFDCPYICDERLLSVVFRANSFFTD